RHPRIDLDGDAAVYAAGRVVRRPEHVARPAHVVCRDHAAGLLRTDLAQREVGDLIGVVVGVLERLREDRRVAGHADHVLVVAQLREAAGDEAFPGNVIEPDRNTGGRQLSESIGHVRLLELPCRQLPVISPWIAPLFAMLACAAATTWSGVKPNCSNST